MRIIAVIALVGGLAAGWVLLDRAGRPEPAPEAVQEKAASPAVPRKASLRLPAPRTSGNHTQPVEENTVLPLLEWLEKGGTNQLRPDELAGYLAANQRSAESLLAAFRTTGDKALLEEALKNFPNDPQVNFTALFHGGTPEERQQRIDALKQAAPDNAMANYLAAREAFKTGNPDLAVEELMAASSKAGWEDYSREFIHSAEEAYRAAGHSEAEAKALAATGLLLPHLQELRDLGRQVNELAGLYQKSGDAESALAAWQIGLNLGQRFEQPTVDNNLLKNLVGIAIQNQILAAMDPATPYDGTGRTVQDELEALKKRRDAIRDLGQQSGSIFSTLTEQELASYFDRQKIFGERATIQWLMSRRKGAE